MSNLAQFKTEDGIELVIDTETGEAFATAKGYARMAGINSSTVFTRLSRSRKGGRTDDIKMAEIQTEGGIQAGRLIPEDTITDWIVGDNPDLARLMLKAGCRLYLYQLAGYKVKVENTSSTGTFEQRLLWQSNQTRQQEMLLEIAKLTGDDRAMITLQSSLQDALIPALHDKETKAELLSVTEVCERHGIHLPKGKDSIVGRKVARQWRETEGTEPQVCAKHIGTGHHAAEIKVYPANFFECILAIASQYLK